MDGELSAFAFYTVVTPENAWEYMIRVAMIARSTLFSLRGGDTVQVTQTAKYLREMGVYVDVKLANEPIDYSQYSLLHFFNIIRPADIVYHIKRSKMPFVVSTVFVDYSGYARTQRTGLYGMVSRLLPADSIEYGKTLTRKVLGRDSLRSLSYIWNGHRRSVLYILRRALHLLPNSQSEYQRLQQRYDTHAPFSVVTNGIDPYLFSGVTNTKRDPLLVICVARIEGIKNQLNLIKALSGTRFRLLLIGAYSSSQSAYYRKCRKAAGENIYFIGPLPQSELIAYYRLAKVHVLPSWFETTGLSSLEAAAMGCNIVITDKGDTREYFHDDGFYCDPASPASIRAAIEKAADTGQNSILQQNILALHTWQRAAVQTRTIYQNVTGLV